jgi:excisionase family DNA binding protein
MATQTLLTPFEAAELLRLPSRRVVRMAKAGEIPHVLLPGDEYRFDEAELWRWVDDHKQPPAEAPAR